MHEGDTGFEIFMLYLFGGALTTGIMAYVGIVETTAQGWATTLFWPVFAIKYLFIGIGMVLGAGWEVLV